MPECADLNRDNVLVTRVNKIIESVVLFIFRVIKTDGTVCNITGVGWTAVHRGFDREMHVTQQQ